MPYPVPPPDLPPLPPADVAPAPAAADDAALASPPADWPDWASEEPAAIALEPVTPGRPIPSPPPPAAPPEADFEDRDLPDPMAGDSPGETLRDRAIDWPDVDRSQVDWPEVEGPNIDRPNIDGPDRRSFEAIAAELAEESAADRVEPGTTSGAIAATGPAALPGIDALAADLAQATLPSARPDPDRRFRGASLLGNSNASPDSENRGTAAPDNRPIAGRTDRGRGDRPIAPATSLREFTAATGRHAAANLAPRQRTLLRWVAADRPLGSSAEPATLGATPYPAIDAARAFQMPNGDRVIDLQVTAAREVPPPQTARPIRPFAPRGDRHWSERLRSLLAEGAIGNARAIAQADFEEDPFPEVPPVEPRDNAPEETPPAFPEETPGDREVSPQENREPAGEDPAGQDPAGQDPAGEDPAGEIPTGETPAGETPPDEAPTAGESPEGAPAGATAEDPNALPAPPSRLPPGIIGAIEVTADRQEYDEFRQIFIATGNAVMRFQGAVIDADRLQVNLVDRVAYADGNVALTRGNQVLQGRELTYNFVQGDGVFLDGYGEIFRPTSGPDFAPAQAIDPAQAALYDPSLGRPLSDRIAGDVPLSNVQQTGQLEFDLSPTELLDLLSGPDTEGDVRKIRFQADRIEFDRDGWVADNVRLTNDPFSPPDLEIRARRARLRRLSPLRDELIAERGRLVLNNDVSLPLPRRTVLDRRDRPPQLFEVGYDEEDRGGLFVQRRFFPINSPNVRLQVVPQYYVQRAFFDDDSGPFHPSAFGLRARATANLTPLTSLVGLANFNSFDFQDEDFLEDDFRASVRLNQTIPTRLGPHSLALEYSYRDRLFNGSLGFRTVRQSWGAVLSSPPIPLWNTGVVLQYQASAQKIEAESDRLDLLELDRNDDLIRLDRTQASAQLSRAFPLWRGRPLPATPDAGLRYTPTQLVPNLSLIGRVRGTLTNYSSGDYQHVLEMAAGIQGQFGHFSRDWFDYTAFNAFYIERFRDGESPFLFDRVADDRILSAGLTQQIYGPFRIGAQVAANLDNSEIIDSSFFLEYSRRAYGITLRVNPERATGSLAFRITDFNWSGRGDRFGDIEQADDSPAETPGEADPTDLESLLPYGLRLSRQALPLAEI